MFKSSVLTLLQIFPSLLRSFLESVLPTSQQSSHTGAKTPSSCLAPPAGPPDAEIDDLLDHLDAPDFADDAFMPAPLAFDDASDAEVSSKVTRAVRHGTRRRASDCVVFTIFPAITRGILPGSPPGISR